MPEALNILGVRVDAVDMDATIAIAADWIATRRPHYMCIRDIHGIMRARSDARLREAHRRAGLVTPDGMPVAWMAWALGHREANRVCGIDLLPALCAESVARGWKHFFYGGGPDVAERLATALTARYPGLQVAGTLSPPFRTLSPAEDQEMVDRINASGADILWIGLGTPKQELWMADHQGRIRVPVTVGVGGAFDINAGIIGRAPLWMQRGGLEWLYRLLAEPRRLWRRYLTTVPAFAALALLQVTGLRRFNFDDKDTPTPAQRPLG